MLPLSLVLVLSLALVHVCSAISWLARPLHAWPLVIALVVGIAVNLLGVVLALPLYPWIDLVVLVVAWSGGLLLGRGVAPGFRPFLLLFLCLSAADVLLTGGCPFPRITPRAVPPRCALGTSCSCCPGGASRPTSSTFCCSPPSPSTGAGAAPHT